MAIWQDFVDGHGFPAGYASVMRSCVPSAATPSAVPEAHAVIQTAPARRGRSTTAPGRWCAIP